MVQTYLRMLYGHMLPLRQISRISETVCVLLISFYRNHQNAFKSIKYSSIDRKLQVSHQD
jgi:hypothetical protein